MITLIHGDDVEKSRVRLNTLLGAVKDKEVRRVDGRSVDVTELTTALGSDSMFGGTQLIVIENLLGSSTKKPTRLSSMTRAIAHAPKDADVLLWEGKELTKTVVAKLGPGVKVFLFKIPIILFQFLDALAPSRSKILIELYQKLRIAEADELVFYLMTRRIRQLLIIRDGGMVDGIAPWQARRLTSQAGHFTMEKLHEMYINLLNMEYSLKRGRTPFDLSELIEQFLVAI